MDNPHVVTIPVPPEMEARFLAGCKHFSISATRLGKKSNEFYLEYKLPADLYWLAANLYGNIPESPLTKKAF